MIGLGLLQKRMIDPKPMQLRTMTKCLETASTGEADEQDGIRYYNIRWVCSPRDSHSLDAITSITRLLDPMPTLLFNSISKPHDVPHHNLSQSPLCRVRAQIIDGISAQRARILVATLEPLVQACSVEQVLARSAALVGHAFVRRDDAVANGALALSLERTDNVALKYL